MSSADLSIAHGEAGYPARLLDLPNPPALLHVRGALPELSPSVAIVGSRRASPEGLRLATRIARDVAAAGVLVVSGGALGIDAAAHRGALEAKGRTLVVLPTALARPAPAENVALFREILGGGGAWVSEQAGDARTHHFCTRNRIIAALADLVLVVEAHARSGTRHTIVAAKRLGRPIAALPWSVQDPRGSGCLDVLRDGGRTVTSGEDVLGLLGLAPRTRGRRQRGPVDRPDPTDLGGRILARLEARDHTVEGLAAELAVEVPELFIELTRLELEGVVRRSGSCVERCA